MADFERFLADLRSRPWAILPAKLAEIRALIDLRLAGGRDYAANLESYREAVQAAGAVALRPKAAGVAVLPCHGTIGPRMNMMMYYSGGCSMQQFGSAFRQLVADPGVGTIVVDFDTPGGGVGLVPEVAEEIRKARETKRIIGVANTLAASAGYWLLSQCSEVVVTPSGEVGSIGVYMLHMDMSRAYDEAGITPTLIQAGKYKTEGNPYQPLDEEAQAALQADVDRFYDMFCGDVAKGRGVGTAEVKANFGQGRCICAKEAVKLGMADRVATMDQVLAKLGAGGTGGGSRAEDEQPAPTAEDGSGAQQAAEETTDTGGDDEAAERERRAAAERRARRLTLLENSTEH